MVRIHYVINLNIYEMAPRHLHLHERSVGGVLWNVRYIEYVYRAVNWDGEIGMALTWNHMF